MEKMVTSIAKYIVLQPSYITGENLKWYGRFNDSLVNS